MKIGIIGSGLVGSTAAYALVMRGIGREIILIDVNNERAMAEADDIRHAVPFAYPLEVRAGDYSDLKGSRLVIIAAGVNQKPGESRIQLLGRNAEVFKQIIPPVLKYVPDTILLIATNPVDIMTHIAAHCAKKHSVASRRVIGSGTTLDTARFRANLGKNLGVDAQHVHGYVVGEHGDSEVLTWSLVAIGGIPLTEYSRIEGIRLDESMKAQIDEDVRKAAYHIIAGKGATYYGIGSALARIANVLLYDQRAILTVCTPSSNIMGISKVTISMPYLVGGNGIITGLPLPINREEKEALTKSAKIIKDYIQELDIE